MKEEDIIKEAEEIDEHIKTHGHYVNKERGPLWYVLAVLLALMVVAMVVPYYGVKLDPEPKYIATIKEVLPAEFEVENISRGINKKQDFLRFLNPSDVVVKQVADKVVSKSGCGNNRVCYSKALFYFVKDNFYYINDPPDEYIKTSRETLKSGGGDCDDGSVLLANLLQSIGVSTRFTFVPRHVYVEAYLPDAIWRHKKDGDWVVLDSTCEYCEFGDISIKSANQEKSYI
jgi:transglutaminase-like putative cysteine protease